MAGPHINYTNRKSYTILRENAKVLDTNCTGVVIENLGTVEVSMKCEGVVIVLAPGESLEYGNDPDVLETTVYQDVVFAETTGDPDVDPIKYLRVTKEQITPYRADD